MIKTHLLNLSASPFLVATVDPATLMNNFSVPARTLRDWLDHFTATGSTTAKAGTDATGNVNRQESELGWYFHPEQVRVKTWESGSAARRAISTELKIAVTEFDAYDVSEVVCLTFPMREFRVSDLRPGPRNDVSVLKMWSLKAAITLADSWSIPLHTEFSTAGQPLSLKLEIEHIVADLTIATTENEAFRDLLEENMSSSNKPVKRELAKPQRDAAGNLINRSTGKTPAKKKSSLKLSRETAPNFPQPQQESEDQADNHNVFGDGNEENEPLFYPSASQDAPVPLSQAQLMHAASQKELEQMDADELAGIWDESEIFEADVQENADVALPRHDEDERPQKIQRRQSNAEEVLGRSLLVFDNNMDEDEDEEAPMTAHDPQEGDNTVSISRCTLNTT